MDNNNQRYLSLFLVLVSCLTCSCHAYQFVVGGRNGWVLNPSENYNHWAERMRFQVNDTLLFKYNNASDSVLVVNKGDYDSCSVGNPIQRFSDGNSIFKFDRSGPFFFISGNKTSCDAGQKLIIVVMAVRNRPTPPSPPSSAPSPTVAPPTGSSPSPSPAGGAPSPSAGAPSPSGGAPSPSAGAPSPSGGAPSPASSPASGAPGASGPSAGSSTSPESPNSSAPASGGGSSTGNTTADGGSPPRSFAAPSCGPSVVLVSALALVMSAWV